MKPEGNKEKRTGAGHRKKEHGAGGTGNEMREMIRKHTIGYSLLPI